ncbi:Clavaminate synthase-like protein [Periconia macrospinosa]|uniref:Clavaminate synthase-like protein n=1 Tax=Periconia macrospinosa TaxID=97972 RepID=A0A2V1CYG7_9PLEO|nr:Clavaminate synthase-like protein [Periconia macrospinosa]
MASIAIYPQEQPHSVDFSLYSHGAQSQKQKVALELIRSIRETGFCRLSAHSITKENIDRVFSHANTFFKLPVDIKSKVKHPEASNPHRGWTEVGRETLSTVADYEKDAKLDKPIILDIKESFDMGHTHDPLFQNMWLPEEDIPGFRADMERFYEECRLQHLELLEALELGCTSVLGFTPNFKALCGKSPSECRMNHYPATRSSVLQSGGNCNRISPHSDFGTLTLLFQDGVGGLEFEDQACRGRFFPVTCDSRYEMLVNAGDVLQRWSNDFFRSVNHFVTLPMAMKNGHGVGNGEDVVPERTSVVFFGKADWEADVGSLPGFEQPETKKYEHMTSLQYNQIKLKATYDTATPSIATVK